MRSGLLVALVAATMFIGACSKNNARRDFPKIQNGDKTPKGLSPSTAADPLGGLPLAGEWQTDCVNDPEFYGLYKVDLKFSVSGTTAKVAYTLTYFTDPDGGTNCSVQTDSGTDNYTVNIDAATLPDGSHAFDLTDGSGTDYNKIFVDASGASFMLGDEYADVDYSGMDPDHRPKSPYTPEVFQKVK